MNLTNRKILVMRHAAVQNPTDMVYSNLPGFPLSALGRRQAEEAGRFLSTTPLAAIFTSGRERAQETAGIVAKLNIGHPQVIVNDDLRDMDLGEYTNKIPFDDWKANRGMYWKMQLRGDGVMETPSQVQYRVMAAWQKIISDQSAAGNILIVSHGGALTILMTSLRAEELKSTGEANCGIGKANVFEVELGRPIRIKKIFEPVAKI
ncbi:MAG: histidine phosphatase family protein [Patescibacteria group bacterium]|jgi:broad specificity phosphatase PhoE